VSELCAEGSGLGIPAGLRTAVGGGTAGVNVAAEVTGVGGVASGESGAAKVSLASVRSATSGATYVIGDPILEPAPG